MDRWIHTGACQGPEDHDTTAAVRYSTWVQQLHQHRRGKTRRDKRAGPSRCLLAGWCRHLRDVIWGGTWRVAAPQAGSSGISIVLCGWLPCPGQVPWPWNWTWAWERDERERELVGSRKSRVEPGVSRGPLPCPGPQVPKSQVASPKSPKSHARVLVAHAHAHTPPTPIMVLVPFPFAFPFAFSFALPFASANSLTHTRALTHTHPLRGGQRQRASTPSPSPSPSSQSQFQSQSRATTHPQSSHHPSSPGSSCPTRRRPLNNKTVLPRPRHRPLPSRAFLCFLSFSHLRPFHQPCLTLQAPFAFSSVDVGSTSEDLRSSRLLNPDSRLSGPCAIAGHLVLRERERRASKTHLYLYIYLCPVCVYCLYIRHIRPIYVLHILHIYTYTSYLPSSLIPQPSRPSQAGQSLIHGPASPSTQPPRFSAKGTLIFTAKQPTTLRTAALTLQRLGAARPARPDQPTCFIKIHTLVQS